MWRVGASSPLSSNMDSLAPTRRSSIGLGPLKYAVQVNMAAEDRRWHLLRVYYVPVILYTYLIPLSYDVMLMVIRWSYISHWGQARKLARKALWSKLA